MALEAGGNCISQLRRGIEGVEKECRVVGWENVFGRVVVGDLLSLYKKLINVRC